MDLYENLQKIVTDFDCKDIYMPLCILHDKRLNPKEKFYLAMYYQYGDNEYFADEEMKEMNISKLTILRIKRKLKEIGLIATITDYEMAKKIVLEQKGTGGKCQWCGTKTKALQKHHFPIPASKGGKDTVLICPNCHYEYHKIIKD